MLNILLGIAATNTVNQAHITLIDPKQGLDYLAFDGLPHLVRGIVDNQREALKCISALVEEMERRYRLLAAEKADNLAKYNRKVPLERQLPALWLVHDEFADWMLTNEYKKGVTNQVSRLGSKARAAGIHLVFAAQRPDAHVMPMQLRSNLGNRLILRVESEGNSEIALGKKGAELLLGRGHLLAKLTGETSLEYAQVPYVESTFIKRAVGIIQKAAEGDSG